LLLLTELTRGNQEIQKIVAFEGGFDRLLEIMREEQMNQGGVVVVDCLALLAALLADNPSNQVRAVTDTCRADTCEVLTRVTEPLPRDGLH
jgi:hypothetical protein